MHLVVQPPQPGAELLAHARVEGAERLVEEQNARLDGKSAGERHPLPLAARELRRVALRETFQLHELEQLVDAIRDFRLRALAHLQSKGDVLPDRHVLEGGIVLEDHPDPARPRRLVRDVVVAEQNLPAVGLLEARDHAQKGRLAAAARAEQSGQGAFRDRD